MYLARGLQIVYLTGMVDTHGFDESEPLRGDSGEARPLRQELMQQAAEVLGGCSLSCAAWVAGVDCHSVRRGQVFVKGHLGVAVESQVLAQCRHDAGRARAKAFQAVRYSAAVHPRAPYGAAVSRDRSADSASLARALAKVAFASAGQVTVVGLRSALGQCNADCDTDIAQGAACPGHGLAMALAQRPDHLLTRWHAHAYLKALMHRAQTRVTKAYGFASAGSLFMREGAVQFAATAVSQGRVLHDAELAGRRARHRSALRRHHLSARCSARTKQRCVKRGLAAPCAGGALNELCANFLSAPPSLSEKVRQYHVSQGQACMSSGRRRKSLRFFGAGYSILWFDY